VSETFSLVRKLIYFHMDYQGSHKIEALMISRRPNVLERGFNFYNEYSLILIWRKLNQK